MRICKYCESENSNDQEFCNVCGRSLHSTKNEFQESCLLISSRDFENRRFGTGFVIYHFDNSSWVVTCAHVVNDVGGETSLNVNGGSAKIIGISPSDDLDLSLLETEGRLNMPLIKLGTYGRYGSPFTTAGFQLFGKHFSIKRIVGRLVQQNELVSKSLSERIKVWAITILGDDTLQDGYSGAPIIDDESGFCIGVVSYKQGDGKNGLAISIDELEKILPKIPLNLIAKPIGSQTTNNYTDFLFEKATQYQIMGELQDSLELFLQVKTLNPTYPRINMMISSVESELQREYVKYGVVRKDMLERAPAAEMQERLKNAPQSRKRFSLLSVGCGLIIVIAFVVLLYFLLRSRFGW